MVGRDVSPESSLRALWSLDESTVQLNHGSFGACPTQILGEQHRLRLMLESDPTTFFIEALPALWKESLDALAVFLNASADCLAFTTNATMGVNAVLRSLALHPGDEVLVLDHAYQACRNTVDHACSHAGAAVVEVALPFPPVSPDEIVARVIAAVTPRTRIAMIDTVTSPTALRLPFERLSRELGNRGIDVLIDAAHGPGIVPLDLEALGAAYVVGNCHKWLYTPKGSGFLYVRRDRRDAIEPLVVSHGYSSPAASSDARFRVQFDWPGTQDPTPWLCIPHAIRFVDGLLPGGLPALMARNHDLALWARDVLSETLGCVERVPNEMISAMVTLPLLDATAPTQADPLSGDPLMRELYDRHRIRVTVFAWPRHRTRYLRVSCAPYNVAADYETLATALAKLGVRGRACMRRSPPYFAGR